MVKCSENQCSIDLQLVKFYSDTEWYLIDQLSVQIDTPVFVLKKAG